MFVKEWLPYALSIGVSYNDFWHITPRILKAFEDSHKKKMELLDEQMWQMGIYIQSAVGTAIEHNFAKNAKSKYITKPLMYKEEKNENTNKESQEQVAVFEANQRIKILRASGLPESPK